MNFNYLLEKNSFVREKLIKFGFLFENSFYLYKVTLKNGDFYALFKIGSDFFNVEVFDSLTNEEYLPFNLKNDINSFACEIQQEVFAIKDLILESCCESFDIKSKILDYVTEKYGSKQEFPWKQYPEYGVLKTEIRNKWYAVFLKVPFKSLGLEFSGTAEILNLKLKPEKFEKLVDNKTFFKAYHMNKKHWITVLISQNVNFEQVISLIDESYSLVEK